MYSAPALASASTASGRTFDGPDPNRPSRGSRSAGIAISGVAALIRLQLSRAVTAAIDDTVRISAAHRGHRRVGHARRRRQGQGAQGGGRAGDRLRRRRARLPDARAHRRGRGRGLPRPRRTTATRRSPGLPELREAIAAKTGARLRARGAAVAGARHQRRQARGLQHAAHLARRGRRGAAAGAVLDDVSRTGRASPARRRSCCRPTRRPASRSPSTSSRRPAPTARSCSCSCRRRTRRARCTHATRSRPSAGGRVEHGIWVVTDEIYEHLTFGGHRVPLDAGGRARAGRPLRRAQRRGQDVCHDRLARRLDDRSARRDHRRHQPPVALDVEREQRRAARRARRGVRVRSTPWSRCAAPSNGGAGDRVQDAQRDRRRHLHRTRGRVLRVSRTSPGCSAAPIAGRRAVDHHRAGRRCCSKRSKVAIVPGEAFGTPGYARISFALGDDDLGEGLQRIADLVGLEPDDGPRPRHRRDRRRRPRPAARRRATTSTCGSACRRTTCSTRSTGAHALIIRSATKVTAEVLDAADSLIVVGRAGIGLDNVDVEHGHRRGRDGGQRAAVEHPLGRRAHDGAAAGPGPQRPAGPRRARRRAGGSAAGGRASSSPTRCSASSASAASASSSRSGRSAFGMRLVAYDPFVSAERARQMSVELVDLDELVARSPTSSRSTSPKTKETIGLVGKDLLAKAKPGIRIINVARGGIVDEDGAGRRDPHRATSPAPRSTCSPRSRPPSRRCSSSTPWWSRRTSGRRRARRRTRRATPSPSRSGSRWPATSCRSRSTSSAAEAQRDGAAVPPAGRAARAASTSRSTRARRHARDRVPGPARRLRHPHPHAVGAEGRVRRRQRRAGVVRQRAAHRDRARRRGARVVDRRPRRTTSTSSPSAAATMRSPARSSACAASPAS